MQLPKQVLWVPVASRNGKCGSQSENNARHSHVPEGQNITNHKVQALEHKAPSLPQKMKTYLELEGKPNPGPNLKPSHNQAPAPAPKIPTP